MAIARPLNRPRVAMAGDRPDSFHKHIVAHVRKMYQSSVESNGRAFYVDVKTNEATGEQEWHVWASGEWRESLCHSEELWGVMETLARQDPGESPKYGGALPGRGSVRDVTARTDAVQGRKQWPAVDTYYVSTVKRTAQPPAPNAKRRQKTDIDVPSDSWIMDDHAGFGEDQPNPFAALVAAAALPY